MRVGTFQNRSYLVGGEKTMKQMLHKRSGREESFTGLGLCFKAASTEPGQIRALWRRLPAL